MQNLPHLLHKTMAMTPVRVTSRFGLLILMNQALRRIVHVPSASGECKLLESTSCYLATPGSLQRFYLFARPRRFRPSTAEARDIRREATDAHIGFVEPDLSVGWLTEPTAPPLGVGAARSIYRVRSLGGFTRSGLNDVISDSLLEDHKPSLLLDDAVEAVDLARNLIHHHRFIDWRMTGPGLMAGIKCSDDGPLEPEERQSEAIRKTTLTCFQPGDNVPQNRLIGRWVFLQQVGKNSLCITFQGCAV